MGFLAGVVSYDIIMTTIEKVTRGFYLPFKMIMSYFLKRLLVLGSLLVCLGMNSAYALNSTPQILIYEGRLLNNVGVPIVSEHVFRFSFWKSSDWTSADENPDGSISVFALDFGGWQEVQSVVPNLDGTFSIKLGTVNVLPDINISDHKYLQVEIKRVGEPDTDYQLMDANGDNGVDTDDRQIFGSIPYAKNSETLDNREIGTTEGSIALIGLNDKWDPSLIPGSTTDDVFVIDADNSVVLGNIALQFGDLLGKYLVYDMLNNYFSFNDNLNVDGDLTVSGAINGVNIGAIDRSVVLEPEYNGSVVNKDGTDNKGKLEVFYADEDGVLGNLNRNYYLWSTQQATLQDVELVIRAKVPENFVSWNTTPINLEFTTLDNNVLNNVIDLRVEDTDGQNVSIVGGTALNSDTWTSADISFSGTPTWTAGEQFTIIIKLSVNNFGQSIVGKLVLNYNG